MPLVLISLVSQSSFGSSYDWCMRPGKYKTCLGLIRPDAENGNSTAQVYLGMMYQDGKGVLQNYQSAFKWVELSAKQGNRFGHLRFGRLFRDGIGTRKDLVRAHMWFNLSAHNGDERGRSSRRKVEKLMTSSEVQNAQELAEKCLSSDYQDC